MSNTISDHDLFDHLQTQQDLIAAFQADPTLEHYVAELTTGVTMLNELIAHTKQYGIDAMVLADCQSYPGLPDVLKLGTEGLVENPTWRPDAAVEANIIQVAWINLLTLIRRIIALITNIWHQFDVAMKQKKLMMRAIYKSLSAGFDEARMQALTATMTEPTVLQDYGEAAERVTRYVATMTEDASFDKLLAAAVSDKSLDADMLILGFKPKIYPVSGATPQFSFEPIQGQMFPQTRTEPLGQLGWSQGQILAITAHGVKMCDMQMALEQSFRVFKAKMGKWEFQANEAMNLYRTGAGDTPMPLDVMAHINNLHALIRTTLMCVTRYTDLVYRLAYITNQNAR